MGFKKDVALYTSGDRLCQLMFGEIKKPDVAVTEGAILVVEQGLGVHATIDFIVRLSRGSDLLSELLTVIPTLSVIHDFMENMPIAKVNEVEFEKLLKMGHLV
jgi:hypothetical protein